MLDRDEREAFATAYRKGMTAEMLQTKTEQGWGCVWTVPIASSEAMERAGQQLGRMRPQQIRHVRRAVLKNAAGWRLTVVVVTIIPGWEQDIYSLETMGRVRVPGCLKDKALEALELAAGFQGQ